ncbi:MAG: hypothetical protein AAFR58_05670 [Cyanobacteria bacterium J06627_28]
MSYNVPNRTSATQSTGVDRAIASLLVAGVTFVLGYTVVRASLAYEAQQAPDFVAEDVQTVVGHQGALWSDVAGF